MSAHREANGLFSFEGKRALVAGGYGGIGREVSRLLAGAGAAVAIAGRSAEKAGELAGELGGDARAVVLDLADRAGCAGAVQEARQGLGGLDVLVNLAGVEMHGPAEEVTPQVWEQSLTVNLSGAFWLAQAAAAAMIEGGHGGRIVLFSSTRGMVGGRRGFAAYGAAKAGVNLLVKQLATEWGRHAITVNGVAPGFVPTPMMAEASADNEFMQMMRNRVPMGRFAEPAEVAAAALFLASPAASFVNGQVLLVDGGVTTSS